ncbi:T9SS type A sorting domain-containing protein [Larkinella bovis]|uniref:T9SS type A sorting domain-containing protein n=1 Tax=Larkinella bovis TaxID=683041 RepID=A0ABW0IHD8_9BACT
MKTALASALLALFVSLSSFADHGMAPFQSSVVAFPSTMKLDVVVQKPVGSNVTIRLIDHLGSIQATQKLTRHENALRTRFDISDLADGIYQVVVTDGTTTQTQEIHIQTTAPTPIPAPYRTISVS